MTFRPGLSVTVRELPRDSAGTRRRLRIGWRYTVRTVRVEDDTILITLIGVRGEYDAKYFEPCGRCGFSDD